MIELSLWLLGCLLLGCAGLSLAMTVRFRRYVRGYKAATPDFAPRLAVILPCKGLDQGFEENVRSLATQDYPDYQLLFVTATEDDPAHAMLSRLIAENGWRHARVLVAGESAGRSQKLNNQLCALRQVPSDCEALVFVDSDLRAKPCFLRELVAPLGEKGVGVATGFRWYIPERGGLGSYLRATWNGGGLSLMADRKLAYAWGGAMAIRRSVFDWAAIAQRWSGALTDDFPLTEGVRSLHMSVRFVPGCLVGSHEDTPLKDVVEWTNRQTLICRVYNPTMWNAIAVVHALHALALALGTGLLAAKLARPDLPYSVGPALLMLGTVAFEIAGGMLLWPAVRRLLPEVGGWGRAIIHALLVPAAVLLILYNSVHSLCTRTIRWRGIAYRLVSADRTDVLPASLQEGALR